MTFEESVETIKPEYRIRECTTFEEFGACLQMQLLVWQFKPLDITPLRSYVANRRTGGFTLGAFDGSDRLVGFAHALPAFEEGLRPYYHSQMLAVDPALRNAGIGVRLKLAQRERALGSRVRLISWTFDPLLSRNAHLNLTKLGGVVRRYLVNHYGDQSTSVLHRGLDTDRLLVEWWLDSEHVMDALAGKRRTERPDDVVGVPRDIEAIKQRDLGEARDWQARIRREFQRCLHKGLYCRGFEIDPAGGDNRYLFFRDDDPERL